MYDKKLDLILSKVKKIDKLESDMQDMKSEMKGMKSDMQGMKEDIQGLKDKVDNLDGKVRNIQIHLENSTDRNIQLLAENFIELTNKLNLAIPAADKNYAYEVKVNYLIEEVQDIKKRLEAGEFATA